MGVRGLLIERKLTAMFTITYFNRSLGKPVTATYATLVAAKAVAESIFQRTGIVVGIERAS